MEAFGYQIDGIRSVIESLRAHGVAANLSDPGVGKTPMTCLSIKDLGVPFGVVAPKSILSQWERTAEACGVSPASCFSVDPASPPPRIRPFRHGRSAERAFRPGVGEPVRNP